MYLCDGGFSPAFYMYNYSAINCSSRQWCQFSLLYTYCKPLIVALLPHFTCTCQVVTVYKSLGQIFIFGDTLNLYMYHA